MLVFFVRGFSLFLPGRDVVEELLVVGLLVAEAVEGLELEVAMIGQLLLDITGAGNVRAGVGGSRRGRVVGVMGHELMVLRAAALQAVAVVLIVVAAIVAALIRRVVDGADGCRASAIVQHVLQTADVLNSDPECVHLGELLAGAASSVRQGIDDALGQMLAEIDESVVHLLDAIALPGIPPGHRWQLLAIRHGVVVVLLLGHHWADVGGRLHVLQLAVAQGHLGGDQLVLLLAEELVLVLLLMLLLQHQEVLLLLLVVGVAVANARHGNPCEVILLAGVAC